MLYPEGNWGPQGLSWSNTDCSQTARSVDVGHLSRRQDTARTHRLEEREELSYPTARDDDEEVCFRIPSAELDWAQHKVVPVDWRVAQEAPPRCFSFAGGAMCRIRADSTNESTPRAERVLVALPGWAVDRGKARRLSASPLKRICMLWRHSVSIHGIVVLEFAMPPLSGAESLADFVSSGRRLAEDGAARLCKHLLDVSVLLLHGPTALSMRGLLDPHSIFIDGDGTLKQWVPVPTVLSALGARAVLEAKDSTFHAPEHRPPPPPEKMHGCVATDAYVISSLVLRAMAGPDGDGDCADVACLPGVAGDFFKRTMYAEPAWRLCGRSALEHPWLRDVD